MTMDIDQLSRSLKDLEYRVKLLEKAQEPKPVEKPKPTLARWKVTEVFNDGEVHRSQLTRWCECGRDVCRAPDCPSHKHDPMGR